jgi:hypothetical protein
MKQIEQFEVKTTIVDMGGKPVLLTERIAARARETQAGDRGAALRRMPEALREEVNFPRKNILT